MKRGWKLALVALMVVAGVGCNPYQQNYQDLTGGVPVASLRAAEEEGVEPVVRGSQDLARDGVGLVEEGYVMVGSASFNGEYELNWKAREQARKVGATVVLLSRSYSHTEVGTVPNHYHVPAHVHRVGGRGGRGGGRAVVHGGYSVTTYQPYAVENFDHYATFWVKGRPGKLGVMVMDLPQEVRQALQRNRGVYVWAVVKGTPAFEADVLRGDVLTGVEEEALVDAQGFAGTMAKYAGRTVVFRVVRGEQVRNVPVTLRP